MSVSIPNNIDESLQNLTGYIEAMKKKLEESIPVVQKLEKLPNIISVTASSFENKSYYGGKIPHTEESLARKKEELLAKLEQEWAAVQKTHEDNLPKLKNNEAAVAYITRLMGHVGIPSTYSQYETPPRGRTKKWVTKSAGWLDDLSRACPVWDGFSSQESAYRQVKQNIHDLYNKLVQEVREVARKEQQERAKSAKGMFLAKMQVKYELAETADLDDVKAAILAKDKYLMLADAMLATRIDWSNDFYRVEDAYNRFSVVTEEDEEIDECIKNILSGDEDDGRVFRDCEYNYDYLFGKVDSQLMEDYNKTLEYQEV